MRYAAGTTVSVERSQSEILKNLRKYGADAFAFGEDQGAGIVRFRYKARPISFRLQLPDPKSADFWEYQLRSKTHRRNDEAAAKLWEQACRQRWRALNLFILATLEAVESGIVPEEEAFIAQTLIRGGETLGEHFAPQIQKAIESGTLPRLLLPGPSAGREARS
jgi:hypothetical protein